MNLVPVRDRIVVRSLEAETVTKTGIVIPDNAAEKPQQGEVLAVGSGRVTDQGVVIPLEVKPGDRVLFGKYAGQSVKINNQDLLVLKEDDVMAIVQGE